jgi:predicted nucleotidyltransferase
MVYSTEELKKRIEAVARQYRIPAVYIFGSYARGDARRRAPHFVKTIERERVVVYGHHA